MKVVLLAGGLGTRISEESHLKPKPMIEIGGMPILWHVMKSYSQYGYNEFIVCLGYKGQVIKEFFSDYFLYASDVTFNLSNNTMTVHDNFSEPWTVTLVDTGVNTMTGGRVKRIQQYIGDETFMLTYGDGVCNINIADLVTYHRSHGKLATITAIQPGGRFGVLDVDNGQNISQFKEKSKEDGGWINGGFMVLEPKIFDYIEGDSTVLEKEPLEKLATTGNLKAYKHYGFWQCMDTQRDKQLLEDLLATNNAPWRTW